MRSSLHTLICPLHSACSQVAIRAGGTVEVRHDAAGKGKGVFARQVSRLCTPIFSGKLFHASFCLVSHTALQAFQQDDLVFTEAPLVGAQHAANRQQILACSHCFQFVGSVEGQLAWRLFSRPAEGITPYGCPAAKRERERERERELKLLESLRYLVCS